MTRDADLEGGLVSVLCAAAGLAVVVVAARWTLLGARLMRRRGTVHYLLLLAAVLLASVPLSVLLTFFLVPFWRWLEAAHGIESIGHSGPAEWCYLAAFLACSLILGGGAGLLMAKRRPPEEAA